MLLSEGRFFGDRLFLILSNRVSALLRICLEDISTFCVLVVGVFLPDFLWEAFGRRKSYSWRQKCFQRVQQISKSQLRFYLSLAFAGSSRRWFLVRLHRRFSSSWRSLYPRRLPCSITKFQDPRWLFSSWESYPWLTLQTSFSKCRGTCSKPGHLCCEENLSSISL